MNVALPRHLKYSIWAAIILSALMLALYAYLGTFSRIITDDYCSISNGLQYGAFAGVIERYNNWSSRYSSFFIEYLLAPQRPMLHQWVTLITIIAFLAAFYYTLYQLGTWLKIPQATTISALVSILLTYYFYSLVPIDQHIFWFGAIIPYVWVLVLSVILLGNFIHYFSLRQFSIIKVAIPIYAAIMVVILAGFIESQVTLMITIFSLMLLAIPFVPRQYRRDYIIIVVLCFVAALIAFALVLASPGIKTRRRMILGSGFSVPLHVLIFEGLLETIFFIFGEFWGLEYGQTFAFVNLTALYGTLVFSGLLLLQKYPDWEIVAPKSLRKTALLVGGVSFVLIASTIVPMYYSARGLPIRALINPRLVQLCTVVIWSYLTLAAFQRHGSLSRLARTRTWPILAFVISTMIFLMPVVSIVQYALYIPNFNAYAQSWDARHQKLLDAEDGSFVVVEPLEYDIETHLVLEKLTDDSTHWVNICAASYYGLEGIEVQKQAVDG